MTSILYHIMSRGVDKQTIFREDLDYRRFINGLFIFNNTKNSLRSNRRESPLAANLACRQREPLVNLHAFCVMPNHYHLLVEPIKENGLSRFLQKLNVGYAKYFNIKYERKGTLFESRFKRIEVSSEAHFIHLPYYIHSNPLDLFDYGWRAREVSNPQKALEFLMNYRWSSHLDYAGKENFPFVTQRELLSEFFNGRDGYQDAFQKWIEEMKIPPGNITLE